MLTPELEAKLKKAEVWRSVATSVCTTIGGVDPNLVVALIAQESCGDPAAKRYEPAFRYLWFPRDLAAKLRVSLADEEHFQMTSWGLMQLMGASFRQQGFQGASAEITPEVGLEHAVRHLKGLFHRWSEETDWISAYNQGSPRKTPGGQYCNAAGYVDPVCQYLRELRRLPA